MKIGAQVLVIGFTMLMSATGVQARTTNTSPFMVAGEIADAPTGFDEMCARDVSLCDAGLPHQTPAAVPTANLLHVRSFQPIGTLYSSGATACVARTADRPAGVSAQRTDAALPDIGASFGGHAALRSVPGRLWAMGCTVRNPLLGGLFATFLWPATLDFLPTAAGGNPPLSATFTTDSAQTVSLPVPAAPIIVEASASTTSLEKIVKRVNSVVNHNVVQVSDLTNVGVPEYWQRAGAQRGSMGDCEDIAIEKRIELLNAGFPPSRLFLAAAFSKRYGMHTVLIARFDTGDYVLDSLSAKIVLWSKAPYVFVRRQSVEDPRVWRRIGTSPTVQMAGAEPAAGHLPIS